MKINHTIIYVPGLGDRDLRGREWLLGLWRFGPIPIEICPMNWTVDEPWPDKLARLINRIETLTREGRRVSLIGESAGASAVTQALQQRTDLIHRVVLLCGKSQYPNRVSPTLYQKNPALRDAIIGSEAAINAFDEQHIAKLINLHPLFDPVVPVAETKITGVKNSRMPIVGHATSIVFANTLWSWWVVYLIKKRGIR